MPRLGIPAGILAIFEDSISLTIILLSRFERDLAREVCVYRPRETADCSPILLQS